MSTRLNVLTTSVALLLGALAVQPAQAQAREGRGAATGLDVQAAADGTLVGLEIDLTVAEVDEGPTTDPFDASDTIINLDVPDVSVTAATISVRTRHVPADDYVESDAATENLAIILQLLDINLVDLTSDTITSVARVDGTCGDFTATGGTVIQDLTLAILGQSLATDLSAEPTPNTVLLDTVIVTGVNGTTLTADAFVILNEQNVAGDQSSIGVNALRIALDITVRDSTDAVVLEQTVDIIVSRSEAAFVNCPADLQLTKTANPDPATVGGSLIYTLVVTNEGPADAVNVVVSDTLDASLTINNAAATGGGTCTVTGQLVTCSWALIANGDSETVTINTTPTQAGTVTNAAVATADNPDPDPDGAEDSVDVDVIVSELGDADLQLTKTADPDPATVGGSLIYTLVVTNDGPEDAVNVVVSDTLDASLTITNAAATGGGSCTVTGQLVNCSWALIANGDSEIVTINTTPTEAGTVTNAAVATADNPDPDPDGAEDSVDVDVIVSELDDADLQLTKTANPDPATVGGSLIYTLVVTNDGQEDAVNVVVSDSLDASLTITNVAFTGSGTCTVTGQLVNCSWALIASGSSEMVTIDTTPTEAGTVTNAAVATADNPDPDPEGAEDSVDVDVDQVVSPTDQLSILEIPTLSQVMLGLLSLLMAAFGVFAMRRLAS